MGEPLAVSVGEQDGATEARDGPSDFRTPLSTEGEDDLQEAFGTRTDDWFVEEGP